LYIPLGLRFLLPHRLRRPPAFKHSIHLLEILFLFFLLFLPVAFSIYTRRVTPGFSSAQATRRALGVSIFAFPFPSPDAVG
jgi:hypothetical protein